MSSINIDLPDEILAEVSRLAQEFNVPRAEIFRRAVGALAKEHNLLADLNKFQALCAELESSRNELADQASMQETKAVRQAQELEEMRRQAAAAGRERELIQGALEKLKGELSGNDAEKASLSRRLKSAGRRIEKMGHVLAERTYLAIRSLEVERLRGYLEKSVASMVEFEKRCRESEAASARLADQTARLTVRLKSISSQRREMAGRFSEQQRETFKRERDIGQLRKELESARGELKTLIKMLGGEEFAAAAKP